MTRKLLPVALLLIIGVVTVSGCAKLTYKRWNTLTLQSDKPEVEAVLGPPNQYRKDDRWMYHNDERQVTVTVEYADGDRVTYSRWFDPEHGLHEIGKPAIEGTDLIERETKRTDINP
jgi:hypothetical protein